MLKHIESLDGRLQSIEENLRPIAAVAISLIESGLLEQLAEYLPEIAAFIRRTFPKDEPKMHLPEVLKYLGLSERTYYRRIADGKLTPRKWEGPDFFYPSDLEAERKESKRRGRI